jgi:hypothetical protein
MHAPSAPSKSDRTSLSGSSARIESGVRAGGARCICCKGPHDPGRCAGHRTGRIATEYVANAGNDDRGRRDFRIVNAFSISGRYGVDIPCDAHWRGDYRSLRERSGICVGCQRRLLVIDRPILTPTSSMRAATRAAMAMFLLRCTDRSQRTPARRASISNRKTYISGR